MDRVPGYEPVGRRFESSRARQNKKDTLVVSFCFGALVWIETCASLKREGSHIAQAISAKRSEAYPPLSPCGVFFVLLLEQACTECLDIIVNSQSKFHSRKGVEFSMRNKRNLMWEK